MPFTIHGAATSLWRGFSDDFLKRNPKTPDGWELYNRLSLTFERPSFLIGLQVDIDRFETRDGAGRLDKAYLEYRGSKVTATAGDFFASFGRGTALSVLKTHEMYGIENQVDDTIEGVRVRYTSGDWRAEALGGSIHSSANGTTDSLYGVTASYKPVSWVRVGASGVSGRMEAPAPDARLVGSQIDLIRLGGIFDISAEITDLESDARYSNGATDGHAAYLEAALRHRDINITFERKEVRNFFFPYSNSPLLEEPTEETLADFMATYAEDLRATKLRGDYTLPTGTLVYGVYAHFNERATKHPTYRRYARLIEHAYVGVDHVFGNGIQITGSLGRRTEDAAGYYYQFRGPTTHLSLSSSVPLTTRNSVEIIYRRSQLDGDLVEYQRNKLAITFARSALFSITGAWESSNLPGEIFHGGQTDFYSVQGELKLRRHSLRLFHGDNRGGMKCSGGVCKYVPAFGGTRVEAILRF